MRKSSAATGVAAVPPLRPPRRRGGIGGAGSGGGLPAPIPISMVRGVDVLAAAGGSTGMPTGSSCSPNQFASRMAPSLKMSNGGKVFGGGHGFADPTSINTTCDKVTNEDSEELSVDGRTSLANKEEEPGVHQNMNNNNMTSSSESANDSRNSSHSMTIKIQDVNNIEHENAGTKDKKAAVAIEDLERSLPESLCAESLERPLRESSCVDSLERPSSAQEEDHQQCDGREEEGEESGPKLLGLGELGTSALDFLNNW